MGQREIRGIIRSVVSNGTILKASSGAIFPFIKGFRRDLRLTKIVSSVTANRIICVGGLPQLINAPVVRDYHKQFVKLDFGTLK